MVGQFQRSFGVEEASPNVFVILCTVIRDMAFALALYLIAAYTMSSFNPDQFHI